MPVLFVSPYSPLPYLHMVPLMFAGRLLEFPAPMNLLVLRVANMTCWLLLVALSIQLAPTRKWSFALLGLLPTAIFQAGSASADVATGGVAFLLTAIFMRAATREEQMGLREGLSILGLCIAIGLMKPGYWSVSFLCLAIPETRFASIGGRVGFLTATQAAAWGPSLAWLAWVAAAGHPQLSIDSNPLEQFRWILANPVAYLAVVGRTVWETGPIWAWGAVGHLGHVEVWLPVTFCLLFPTALLLSARADCLEGPGDRAPPEPTRGLRAAALFALSTGVVGMISMSYLGWNPVGAELIRGVQGRYFLPILPLLIPLLPNLPLLAPEEVRWGVSAAAVLGLAVALVMTIYQYYLL